MPQQIPQPPYRTDEPGDAIATALVIFACIAEDVRRIADRLDSWTHDPDDPWSVVTRATDGPELRVRRW